MCSQLNPGTLEPEQMWGNLQSIYSQIGLTVCRSILSCFRWPLTPTERHALALCSDSLGLLWQHARFLLAAAYLFCEHCTNLPIQLSET